jgi:hypothetical protein
VDQPEGGMRRACLTVVAALVVVGCGGSSHSTAHAHGAHRAAAQRAAPQPITITVEASGDLLIHSPVWEAAIARGGGSHYDFAALFTKVEPIIRSVDLPLCHVETPMTPAPPSGYPIFNTPPALARAIHQIGFKACSTAATHSLDKGQTGIDDTVRYLGRAHVLNTGEFPSAAARHHLLIMTIKGVRVAFLSYTELTNGIPSPHPWSVNRAQNVGQILSDARRARRHGARVVIVNIHWGDENVTAPSSFQLSLARTLSHSPNITAVIGQHVHVPQPIRRVGGKLVVFGEGNLISNQTVACCPAASQDGLIALLTIKVDAKGARVRKVRYVPIWVRHPDFEVLPAGLALRYDHADAAALRASYDRTVAVVGRNRSVQPVPAHLP